MATCTRDKCPAKGATCKFCGRQGHFERVCLKKKGTYKDKKSKHQHGVDIESDQESSECRDDFDLSAVSIHSVKNHESREVFAPVVFHPEVMSNQCYEITGKVDTGAMLSCMPTSMLPRIGLSKKDLKPSDAIIRGMSGADLQNCGAVDIKVTCNNITALARFYITKQECAFILCLEFCKEFKLVSIAPVCIQQNISMEPNQAEAVQITEESAADYLDLKEKWKHLPLGASTTWQGNR